VGDVTASASAGEMVRHPATTSFLNGSVPLLVGGQEVQAADGQTFATHNPATGEELARVAHAGVEDVGRAVAAARRTFDTGAWRNARAAQRTAVLWRFSELLAEHREPLAQLDTLDNGMPLRDAHAAVDRAIEHFRYFAGWATKVYGDTIPVSVPGRVLNYTRREPVGVVGAVIAWNTPIDNAVWKLAAPLAVGCSVILKPAEQTPLSAVYLGRLLVEAGIPAGVVSVLPGFGEAGAALAAHPAIDKVAFTGSTDVGREIVRASAGNLKRVSLELGGKSPAIVFADADMETAATGCCAGSSTTPGRSAARARGRSWSAPRVTRSSMPSCARPRPCASDRERCPTRRWAPWSARSSSTACSATSLPLAKMAPRC
jgi:aldehyde dehydrogenase (NAD+)